MKFIYRLAVFCCVFAGQLNSVALANESNLVIPLHSGLPIEYVNSQEMVGIDPSAILQVFVGKPDTCCDGRSPIAGSYTVNANTVLFDPTFEFIEGQHYTIKTMESRGSSNSKAVLTEFSIKPINLDHSPSVVAIFPSAHSIPENTLRFYIHFSTPVKPQVAANYIKLVNENGTYDNETFMEFKQELWSEDRKRLTVLFDPGRIKRGVAQNRTLGPALTAGKTYSLVIESGWPIANGLQTLPRFEHNYLITDALRTLPNVDLWNVIPPKTLTRNPLLISLDRPFDSELLQNGITVLDERGQKIRGKVSVANNEKTWQFDPQNRWTNRKIKLSIDARLEDVAGNNFRELLDHPVDGNLNEISQIVRDVALLPSSE